MRWVIPAHRLDDVSQVLRHVEFAGDLLRTMSGLRLQAWREMISQTYWRLSAATASRNTTKIRYILKHLEYNTAREEKAVLHLAVAVICGVRGSACESGTIKRLCFGLLTMGVVKVVLAGILEASLELRIGVPIISPCLLWHVRVALHHWWQGPQGQALASGFEVVHWLFS